MEKPRVKSLGRLDYLLQSNDVEAINAEIGCYNIAIREIIEFGETLGVSNLDENGDGGFLSNVFKYDDSSLGQFIFERDKLLERLELACEELARKS